MLTLRHLAPGEVWPGGKGVSAAEAKAASNAAAKAEAKAAAKAAAGGAKLSLVVRRQPSDTPLGISLSDDNVVTLVRPGSAAEGVLQVGETLTLPHPYPNPSPNPNPNPDPEPEPGP